MFLLAFFLTIFCFLFLGALVFLAFTTAPRLRPKALSAALWCAVWGPSIVAFEMLAGLSLAAEGLAAEHWAASSGSLPQLPVWSSFAILTLIATILLATAAAWLHQAMINRMTFALFRIYATFVVAGIGSVFGLASSFWLGVYFFPHLIWLLLPFTLIVFTSAFGFAGFRGARSLRGERPTQFQWVTQAEFDGQHPSAN